MAISAFRIARQWVAERRGSMAIEAALAIPIVILLMLGTVDFGRLLWTMGTLQHAAREGTRYAIVRGTDGGMGAVSDETLIDFVKGRAAGLRPEQLAVTVAWGPGRARGSTVAIELTYPFDFFLGGFFPIGSLTVEGAASMIVS